MIMKSDYKSESQFLISVPIPNFRFSFWPLFCICSYQMRKTTCVCSDTLQTLSSPWVSHFSKRQLCLPRSWIPTSVLALNLLHLYLLSTPSDPSFLNLFSHHYQINICKTKLIACLPPFKRQNPFHKNQVSKGQTSEPEIPTLFLTAFFSILSSHQLY